MTSRHGGVRRARLDGMAIAIVALLAAGCGSDSGPAPAPERVATTRAWANGPHAIAPQDVKAAGPEVVWAVDDIRNVVVRIDARDSTSNMFGHGEAPPVEVVEPRRIAVAPAVGVIAYDESTGNIDLFTPGGILVRSLSPGFAPAYMTVTAQPISLVSAVQHRDTDDVRGLLVLSTDLMGDRTDTLVGPNHGPATLGVLSANPRETSLAGSETGMWIWSKAVPDTVYDVGIHAPVRKLVLRERDRAGLGVLHDLESQLLWVVHEDTAGLAYAGYDVGLEGETLGSDTYIGTWTTPPGFTPKAASAGLLIGTEPLGNALLFSAYDTGRN